MNKLAGAALLAAALLAPSARAQLCCPPFKIEAGANCHFRMVGPINTQPTQLGPWYLYWPLEAHFQTPAMPCYPNYPPPMGLPPSAPMAPGANGAPALPPTGDPALPTPSPMAPTMPPADGVGPANFHQPAFQPVGYYSSQAPSYWYKR